MANINIISTEDVKNYKQPMYVYIFTKLFSFVINLHLDQAWLNLLIYLQNF